MTWSSFCLLPIAWKNHALDHLLELCVPFKNSNSFSQHEKHFSIKWKQNGKHFDLGKRMCLLNWASQKKEQTGGKSQAVRRPLLCIKHQQHYCTFGMNKNNPSMDLWNGSCECSGQAVSPGQAGSSSVWMQPFSAGPKAQSPALHSEHSSGLRLLLAWPWTGFPAGKQQPTGAEGRHPVPGLVLQRGISV